MDQFTGKTAFVTGGASGIGFGLCRAFGRRGMKVAIADVEARDLRASRRDACAAKASASSGRPATCRTANHSRRRRQKPFAAFGKVHILCNNAGVSRAGPIETIAPSDWDWVIGVNLKGLVHGLQLFLPHMKAHGEARPHRQHRFDERGRRRAARRAL